MKKVSEVIKRVYLEYEDKYNSYAEKYRTSFYKKKLISEGSEVYIDGCKITLNSDALINQNLIIIADLINDVRTLELLSEIIDVLEEYDMKYKEIFGCKLPITLSTINNMIAEKYCELSVGITRMDSDDFARIKYKNQLNLESCISIMDAWFLIGENGRNDIGKTIDKQLRVINAILHYSDSCEVESR